MDSVFGKQPECVCVCVRVLVRACLAAQLCPDSFACPLVRVTLWLYPRECVRVTFHIRQIRYRAKSLARIQLPIMTG